MKVTALACFSSNGVEGFPGKVLSVAEIQQVAEEMSFLKHAKLISITEMEDPGAEAPEKKEPKEEPKADPTGIQSVSNEIEKKEVPNPKGKKSK